MLLLSSEDNMHPTYDKVENDKKKCFNFKSRPVTNCLCRDYTFLCVVEQMTADTWDGTQKAKCQIMNPRGEIKPRCSWSARE